MLAFEILLGVHVTAGSTALLLGPVPMFSRKGGGLHRAVGKAFCAAMACSSASAFVLALVVHSNLLLTIAVLTAFLIFSGMRAPSFRRGASPCWIDDLSCLLLACFGVWLLWRSSSILDVTGLFFGVVSLILSALQGHRQHSTLPDWLLAHITGMGGAYVATVTAFLVVNVRFLPKPVTFIVPTIIGALLITWTVNRYASRIPTQMNVG